MTDLVEDYRDGQPLHYVIQGPCLEFRCDDPEQSCGGECTCPHHDLETADEVAHFARGLRGDPDERCSYCQRWLRRPAGRTRLPRHNHPVSGRRCIGSGSLASTWLVRAANGERR